MTAALTSAANRDVLGPPGRLPQDERHVAEDLQGLDQVAPERRGTTDLGIEHHASSLLERVDDIRRPPNRIESPISHARGGSLSERADERAAASAR